MGPCVSFSKTASGQWSKVREGKTSHIHLWSFCFYYHHCTNTKGLLHDMHVLLLFPWVEPLWSHFSFPSVGSIHCSSTVLTLSNRHSWLAFPSHSRKYKSLLFSCITASMHFPERMWTIIPFWKERRKGKKKKKKMSWSPTISQQRRRFLRFVLIIKRIIKVIWTGLVRNWSILVTI